MISKIDGKEIVKINLDNYKYIKPGMVIYFEGPTPDLGIVERVNKRSFSMRYKNISSDDLLEDKSVSTGFTASHCHFNPFYMLPIKKTTVII